MPDTDDSANTSSPDRSVAPAEICAGCHQPLVRRGPKGECLRCLLAFAFPAGGEASSVNAPVGAGPSGNGLPRYGHFDIEIGADGHPVELGAGAMATTYRALDSVLHSTVALKVINQKVAEHPSARARFLREARAAAKLHHPNVASVSHYGEQNGECYYVMELVEGETIEARVRRTGPLAPALALEIGVQVARALAAAEACGVVHRDLKPSNIMLTTPQGEKADGSASTVVKVIDWGLAKAVSAESALGTDHTHGGFVGTPAFASPEQFARAENQRIDHRSDIYSLGVTLWYLLCGRTPFAGTTLEEIRFRQVEQPMPLEQLAAARVPARIVALLKSMMAVDPAVRPQSARELLDALRACQEHFPFGTVRWPARRRFHRATAGLTLLALAAGSVAGWWIYVHRTAAPTDRSVAVLPFENLSPDAADGFFTVGVQDEITADLARIASLNVVGSGSTHAYATGHRDLAQIGRELGVWHLLEGSVRREGGEVRVSVRLTDLHDPAHPWTSQYVRRLTDVFAVQGEITRAVADRLRVTLSDEQKAVINEPPTSDLAAYDLYLRAREVPRATTGSPNKEICANALRAVHWLDEAIARDPKFSLAYCELARRHDELYFYRSDGPPEELLVDHRGLAERALARAARLRPNSGELHLSQAIHALQINNDPEQSEEEIQLARRSLPNNAQVEVIAGRIARRLDHWDEAVRFQERAISLEPRDRELLQVLSTTYHFMRRYDDFDRTYANIIALTPSGELRDLLFGRAAIRAESAADLAPSRDALPALRAASPADDEHVHGIEVDLARWTRDSQALDRLLHHQKWEKYSVAGVVFPRAWFEALAAQMQGDQVTASRAFAEARAEMEKALLAQRSEGYLLSLMAIADAGMGQGEKAVEEAKRACELTPFSTMNLIAPVVRCNLAVVYSWTGQNDLAFAELDKLVDRPGGQGDLFQPSYGDLRLNPLWDSLRGDPRFEALVRRFAPPPPAPATFPAKR